MSDVVAHTLFTALGTWEQEKPWSSLASQSSLIDELQDSIRGPLSKEVNGIPENDTWGVSTPTATGTTTHVQMHVHQQVQATYIIFHL